MKVHGALYIPTKEYNYKVTTGYGIILQAYYITQRYKSKNTRRYKNMDSRKQAHELQKGNSRAEQGAGRNKPRMINQ